MPGYRRTIALAIAAVVAASLLVVPSASAATCPVHQGKQGVRWIYKNGQRVNAEPTMTVADQKEILQKSCYALSTITALSFKGLPKLWVEYAGDTSWGYGNYGNGTDRYYARLSLGSAYFLRHEFFHHYLEAGAEGSAEELVTKWEKRNLFKLAHQIAPNGYMDFFVKPIPRYWPNETAEDVANKEWFGWYGAYDQRAGENYAELLDRMFDGHNDGVDVSSLPLFAGRNDWVLKRVQEILGFSGYNP